MPGANSDDVVTDITEAPYRLGAVARAGGAQVIATVDVPAGEDDWNAPPTAEHPRPRRHRCYGSTVTGSSGSTTVSTAAP
jgi:hypothetical protein